MSWVCSINRSSLFIIMTSYVIVLTLIPLVNHSGWGHKEVSKWQITAPTFHQKDSKLLQCIYTQMCAGSQFFAVWLVDARGFVTVVRRVSLRNGGDPLLHTITHITIMLSQDLSALIKRRARVPPIFLHAGTHPCLFCVKHINSPFIFHPVTSAIRTHQ